MRFVSLQGLMRHRLVGGYSCSFCMENSYEELKLITDKYYTDWIVPGVNVFIELLRKYRIETCKRKDGILYEVNFSIPKSVKDGIVVGFRYKKKDNSFSEDLFLFQKNKKIIKGYRGSLENSILVEYSETHKLPPNT